jgi:hypothetical protein
VKVGDLVVVMKTNERPGVPTVVGTVTELHIPRQDDVNDPVNNVVVYLGDGYPGFMGGRTSSYFACYDCEVI